MRIVCISDTHGAHHKIQIPEGDVLIHAGDFTSRGLESEVIRFNRWLGTLPHRHKVVIAGNHDFIFEKQPRRAQNLLCNAIYLEDSGVEIEGVNIWGSPITPWFFDWAFNRQRGEEIDEYWKIIPENTHILVTHGPPFGILDRTIHGMEVGCKMLTKRVKDIQPDMHIFGHIHEAQGIVKKGNCTFVNASIMDVKYKARNPALVFEYERESLLFDSKIAKT